MCTDNSHDFVEITEHKEAFTFDVEVARKILNARDALILNDVDEAYHQLCTQQHRQRYSGQCFEADDKTCTWVWV